MSQAFPQDLLKDFGLGHHSICFHIVVMVPEVSLWESKLHLLYQRSVNSAALTSFISSQGEMSGNHQPQGNVKTWTDEKYQFIFSHSLICCFCGFMFEYVLYLTLKTHSIQTNSTQAFLIWSHV